MSLNTKNENLASEICKIYYEFIRNVDSIDDGSDQYHKTITFKSGGAWNEIKFTAGSATMNQQGSHDSPGKIYDQSITASIPGEDDDSISDISAIADQPVLIKVVYTSGQEKLIGNLDNPAKIMDTGMIGGKQNIQLNITRRGDKSFWLE